MCTELVYDEQNKSYNKQGEVDARTHSGRPDVLMKFICVIGLAQAY